MEKERNELTFSFLNLIKTDYMFFCQFLEVDGDFVATYLRE